MKMILMNGINMLKVKTLFSLITSKRKLNRVDDGMEENEKDEFNTINFRKKTGHKLYYNFENDDLIGELDNPYFSYDT